MTPSSIFKPNFVMVGTSWEKSKKELGPFPKRSCVKCSFSLLPVLIVSTLIRWFIRILSPKIFTFALEQLARYFYCFFSFLFLSFFFFPFPLVFLHPHPLHQDNKKWYKIGDMGLIKGNQRATDSLFDFDFDTNDGDCRYLAPEVLNAPSTPQSDIFSLGMSMLHLATGVDPPKHLYQREKGVGRLSPEFSVQFRKLLRQMVDPDPLERPTAKELLNHPLLVSGGDTSVYEEMAEENMQLKREVALLKEKLLLLTKSNQFLPRASPLSSPRRF